MEITQKTWFNGATNDAFTPNRTGQFYACKWVDIQSNSIGFSLSKQGSWADMWSNATLWDWMAIIWYWTDIYHIYKNWKVLKNLTTSPYYYEVTTWDTNMYNATLFTMTWGGWAGTTELVIVGHTWVSRISLWWASPSVEYENFATLTVPTTSGGNYRPMTIANTNLYIGNGNCVDMLDYLGVLVNWITLDRGDVVRSLLTRWDEVIIVTSNKVIFWDWFSATFNSQVHYVNYNITNAVMLWSYIYLIADDWMYDYIIPGGILWQDEPFVKKRKSTVMNFTSDIHNKIETQWNTIYIPSTDNTWIVTYGANFPWMYKGLGKSLTNTNWSIKCMVYYNGSMYINTVTGWKNYFNEYDLDTDWTYLSGGNLETNPIYFEDIKNVCSSDRMIISYTADTWTSIKAYESINWWAYAEIKTITCETWTNTAEFTISTSRWHYVQYKFELITWNVNYDVMMHSYTLFFTQDERL
jgi:hypothetical protein